jgi:hypothetical protein
MRSPEFFLMRTEMYIAISCDIIILYHLQQEDEEHTGNVNMEFIQQYRSQIFEQSNTLVHIISLFYMLSETNVQH